MPNGHTTRLRELEGLLLHPREDLHIEIKEWMDLHHKENRANLAQAILALANHGGGFIVIGFTETEEKRFVPDTNRPPSLADYAYNQDEINGIVEKYADPSFHCTLESVEHPETRDQFPIITIPGGHAVPIRAKKSGHGEKHVKTDTYYIRRPGPQSAPPKTSQEWDSLIRRCVLASRNTLLDSIRMLFERGTTEASLSVIVPGPQGEFDKWIAESNQRFQALCSERYAPEVNPYRRGIYVIAYWVTGENTGLSQKDLLLALKKVEGRETGWPAWWSPDRDDIRPYPQDSGVECWMIGTQSLNDPGHIDFWRASPAGKLFLVRGYEEDGEDDLDPGTVFDLTLPIWRVGECLLHAQRFAEALDRSDSDVIFHVAWTGLTDRRLEAWASRSRIGLRHRRVVAHQDSFSSQIVAKAATISAGLVDYVSELTKPLYNLFDFYEPPKQIYIEELKRMRRGV